MSVFKNFWDFVRGKMLGGSEVTISSDELAGLVDREKLTELSLYEFALCSGINIIANALSACEIRTFVNNKEIHGEEYYLWNYSPHYNYNANEFLQKIVWNLIYKNECLVVETRGGLVVADSYEHEVYALYQDVFRNVIVNSDSQNGIPHPYTFPQSFRMEDVLFYRLSSRNIKSILDYLMEGYRSLLETAIDKFQKSAGERGILTIDGNAAAGQNYGTKPDGTLRTFNDVFTEMMNERFKSYFNAKNAVMPIWKGFDYQIKGPEAYHDKGGQCPADPATADAGDRGRGQAADAQPDYLRDPTDCGRNRDRKQPQTLRQGGTPGHLSDDRSHRH